VIRWLAGLAALLMVLTCALSRRADASIQPSDAPEQELRIGSKKFTESVILGELGCHLVRQAKLPCEHRRDLGGTRVLWAALQRGDIDVYPEYTGTLIYELLALDKNIQLSFDELKGKLAAHGVLATKPLGFNNTYALAMKKERAAKLGITRISDLQAHPSLALRFSNEFMDRGDGWPALRASYALPHEDVRGLDHDLAYRGLDAGDVDVMDAYTTDADVNYYGLLTLEDDKQHFPRYDALFLYRAALAPAAVKALERLQGRIDDATMLGLNVRAKLDKVPEATVAGDFANETFGLEGEARIAVKEKTRMDRLLGHTADHLFLVGISLLAAVLFALPLGILAARRRRLGQVILALVGIVQTIPTLALLVFMIPLLGIGAPPAILALFLYSLLPIVRNTHQGLTSITPTLLESANALGLPSGARLWRVELPLASQSILAGIKTSAVINVGTATLGALIGAGGYGQPILTGIRLDDTGLIMEGAVPAALLALLVQSLFDLSERVFVPRGLRLSN
jgi:osmoprotectant transport system permease protein